MSVAKFRHLAECPRGMGRDLRSNFLVFRDHPATLPGCWDDRGLPHMSVKSPRGRENVRTYIRTSVTDTRAGPTGVVAEIRNAPSARLKNTSLHVVSAKFELTNL